MEYRLWVLRNKESACAKCGKSNDLECHHIVAVQKIIHGYWQTYGSNEELIFEEITSDHEKDKFPAKTLCKKCHEKMEPVTAEIIEPKEIAIENWTAMPRKLNIQYSQSTSNRQNNTIGLLSLQTLMGIGWYICNGHMENRIILINKNTFAKLLHKKNGTSFEKSLGQALESLQENNVLSACYIPPNKKITEIHISKAYIRMLKDNPWFIPLKEVHGSKMSALTLKIFLSYQSNKKEYKIGIEKLAGHINITTPRDSAVIRCIKNACSNIPWADVKINDRKICTFKIKPRKAIPIHTLRSVMLDSLDH